MKYVTESDAETVRAGENFAGILESHSIILMYGEMGAGKTHFVKGIARGLGIDTVVTSPTFAIVNEYHNSEKQSDLYHFDLFRLRNEDDLYAVGFYDYIDCGVIAVEWAENVPELEGEFSTFYRVTFTKTGEHTREIEIHEITRT
jgi:tRNA threonylcarbamoyladenosine biosynthesis protein TsaE